ncbi:host attachment protein [Caenimonas terrae]|uniref:Host attachment protein n=1 Tax=Caenimonas terrae TaxID=696074 RepID=A0ABW0NH85_9BURK
MKPDWILIANAGHARLLQHESGTPLVELKSFEHPASRLHTSELGDDKAGRQKSDSAFGGAAFPPRMDPHHKEQLHFASELAAALEQAAGEGRFQRLTVYASSPFLGELKAALGASTMRLLAGTHDLDLTSFALAEIESRIAAAH